MIAGLNEMMADAAGRSVQFLQRGGRLTVQRSGLRGRYAGEQRFAEHAVPEGVTDVGPDEQPMSERRVENVVGLILRQSADADELVRVERGPDDRRRGTGSHVPVGHRARSRRLGERGRTVIVTDELDDGEGQTARCRPHRAREVARAGRRQVPDEGDRVLPRE